MELEKQLISPDPGDAKYQVSMLCSRREFHLVYVTPLLLVVPLTVCAYARWPVHLQEHLLIRTSAEREVVEDFTGRGYRGELERLVHYSSSLFYRSPKKLCSMIEWAYTSTQGHTYWYTANITPHPPRLQTHCLLSPLSWPRIHGH
jgi:hypothetical protein